VPAPSLVVGLVVGLVLAALGGCASDDRVPDAGRPDRVLEQCSHKIDSQIEAGIVPNADREYATGMCLRVP
jgi:hypothetical protein